ncbi:MAG: excalibur calcium-binding domain-containing protein [Denitromonas halophila]|nr:MAG: excalibur calcium-binding domain-containing protein [Denitromonas halophila]
MKRLLMIGLLAVAGWKGYGAYQDYHHTSPLSLANAALPSAARTTETRPTAQYACDGRTHCSQMRSCAEATFFLRNCPDVKMDGDNDGVPCERQWCND